MPFLQTMTQLTLGFWVYGGFTAQGVPNVFVAFDDGGRMNLLGHFLDRCRCISVYEAKETYHKAKETYA